MLYCESCDYLKTRVFKSSNESKSVCEFTGFVFDRNIEDYVMEIHPCYDYEVSKSSMQTQPKRTLVTNKFKIA